MLARRASVEIIPKETRALDLPGSARLIRLIETEAGELAKELVKTLREHPYTPSFHSYTAEELYERGFNLYHNLGAWLSRKSEREDLVKYYEALGAQRCEEGFPLWEVLHALNLTRRVLWKKIEEQGLLDTAEDFIQAMELHNQVLLFFDRAIMYTAKGYEVASPSHGA
jgi:hypothetical protein